MASLTIKNLTKKYFGGTVALSDISMEIEAGGTVVLLGGKDAGKTTLLKIIAGLIKDYEGEIYIDGVPAKEIPIENRNIAYATLDAMKKRKTVFETLTYPLRLRNTDCSEIAVRLNETADLTGIVDILTDRIDMLTPYLKTKVAIARAVMRTAGIYIFDSLFDCLPEDERYELLVLMREIRRRTGGTFIFATEESSTAFSIDGKVVLMSYGYISQIGTMKEICGNPANKIIAKLWRYNENEESR